MFSHIALVRSRVAAKSTTNAYLLVNCLYMGLQVARPSCTVMTMATKVLGSLMHSSHMLLQVLSAARLEPAVVTVIDIVLMYSLFVRLQVTRSCCCIITLVATVILRDIPFRVTSPDCMHCKPFFRHKILTALVTLKGKWHSMFEEHMFVQVALITQALEADVTFLHRLLGVHCSYVFGEGAFAVESGVTECAGPLGFLVCEFVILEFLNSSEVLATSVAHVLRFIVGKMLQ